MSRRGESATGATPLALPHPPGIVRRFWRTHPHVADIVLGVVWAGSDVLVAAVPAWQDGQVRAPLLVTALLSVVAVAGIPFRRRAPIVTVAVAMVAAAGLAFSTGGVGPLLYGVFAASVYLSPRAGWWAAAIAAVLGVTTTAIRVLVVAPGSDHLGDVLSVPLLALLTVAALIGLTVGNRRRYTDALIDRAHQLARERDQQAELATATERARIAREMHDIVSHSVTVIVRLAEAVAADLDRTDAVKGSTKDAAHAISDVGRTAMTDMRRMLGVLGTDQQQQRTPQPAASDLTDLIEGFRVAGAPVILRLTGPLPDDETLQLTVYRILQEGITNAMRYATAPRSITAEVVTTADAVTVAVTDDGREATPRPSLGAGRGLVGLRERTHALGGSLSVGPRSDASGWVLRASIPLGPEPR